MLVIILGVVCVFSHALSSDWILYFRDHIDGFRPRYWEIVESFRHGRLPALTRADNAGVPTEYQLSGTYTPLVLILFLGPFDIVYDWFIAAHVVLLGVGAFVLARHLANKVDDRPGFELLGPLLAAIVATFSGPLISCENLVDTLIGVAYAPWVYWALHRALHKPSGLNTALLAFTTACHAQGGQPILLFADVAVFVWFVAGCKFTWKTAAHLATAAVIAAMIASIQIGPVIEFLGGTKRGHGFSIRLAAQRSVTPWQLLEMIVPVMWSFPDAPYIAVPQLTGQPAQSHLLSHYFGTALVVAIASRSRLLLILAITTVVISMGLATPLYGLIHALPVMSLERFPSKFLYLSAALIAAMMPLGLRSAASSRNALVAVSALHTGILIILAFWVASQAGHDFLAHAVRPFAGYAFPRGIAFETFPEIARSIIDQHLLHAIVFSSVLTLIAIVSRRWSELWTARSIAIVVGLDLILGARFVVQIAPAEPSGPPPEVLARVATPFDRYFALAPDGHMAEFNPHAGETHYASWARSTNLRGRKLYREIQRLPDFDRSGTNHPSANLIIPMLEQLNGDDGLRLLERAGVGWVFTSVDLHWPNPLMFSVPDEAPQYAYPLAGVRPYASMYDRWRVVDVGAIKATALLMARSSEAILLRNPNQDLETPSFSGTSTCATPARVEYLERDPDFRETTRLRVSSECPGLVVVREFKYPGWQVEVDGRPQRLLEAEFGFIAAEVPKGEHELHFFYRAKASKWVPVSLAGLLAALVLIAVRKRA